MVFPPLLNGLVFTVQVADFRVGALQHRRIGTGYGISGRVVSSRLFRVVCVYTLGGAFRLTHTTATPCRERGQCEYSFVYSMAYADGSRRTNLNNTVGLRRESSEAVFGRGGQCPHLHIGSKQRSRGATKGVYVFFCVLSCLVRCDTCVARVSALCGGVCGSSLVFRSPFRVR